MCFSVFSLFQIFLKTSAQNLIDTLWLIMESGLEELRILQTLLLILTTTRIVRGDSFAKVIHCRLIYQQIFFKSQLGVFGSKTVLQPPLNNVKKSIMEVHWFSCIHVFVFRQSCFVLSCIFSKTQQSVSLQLRVSGKLCLLLLIELYMKTVWTKVINHYVYFSSPQLIDCSKLCKAFVGLWKNVEHFKFNMYRSPLFLPKMILRLRC